MGVTASEDTNPHVEVYFTDSAAGIVYFLFQMALTLWVLVSSCFTWTTVRTTHHLHTSLNYFVGSLILVNYIHGASSMPLSLINDAVVWRWKYGRFFCEFWQSLAYVCQGIAAWCILFMMIDRVLFHCRKERYIKREKRWGRYLLLSLWIGAAGVSVVVYFTLGSSSFHELTVPGMYQCHLNYDNSGFVVFTFIFLYLLPLVIAVIIYIVLLVRVRRALLFEVRLVSRGTRVYPMDYLTREHLDYSVSREPTADDKSFSLCFTPRSQTDSRNGPLATPRSAASFCASSYNPTSPRNGKDSSLSIMSNTSVDLPAHLTREMSISSTQSMLMLSSKVWHKAGTIVLTTEDISAEDLVKHLPPDEAAKFALPNVDIPTFCYVRPMPLLYKEPSKALASSLPVLPVLTETAEEGAQSQVITEKPEPGLLTIDEQSPSRDSGIDSPEVDLKHDLEAGYHGDGRDLVDTKGQGDQGRTNEGENVHNDLPKENVDLDKAEIPKEACENIAHTGTSSQNTISQGPTGNSSSCHDNIHIPQQVDPGIPETSSTEVANNLDPDTPRRMTSVDMATPDDDITDDITHTEYNALKKLGIIIFAYLLLWLPHHATIIALSFSEDCEMDYLMYSFLVFVGYANCAVNPLAYLLCFADFRAALKKILRCRNPNKLQEVDSEELESNTREDMYATSYEETEFTTVTPIGNVNIASQKQHIENDMEVSEC